VAVAGWLSLVVDDKAVADDVGPTLWSPIDAESLALAISAELLPVVPASVVWDASTGSVVEIDSGQTVCEASAEGADEVMSEGSEAPPSSDSSSPIPMLVLSELTGVASEVWEVVSDEAALMVSELIVWEASTDWALIVWALSLDTPASVEAVVAPCELIAVASTSWELVDVDAAKSELVEM
jgi:hypothetical protein